MNLASSDIKVHKVYLPYVSPITASSVECFTIQCNYNTVRLQCNQIHT